MQKASVLEEKVNKYWWARGRWPGWFLWVGYNSSNNHIESDQSCFAPNENCWRNTGLFLKGDRVSKSPLYCFVGNTSWGTGSATSSTKHWGYAWASLGDACALLRRGCTPKAAAKCAVQQWDEKNTVHALCVKQLYCHLLAVWAAFLFFPCLPVRYVVLYQAMRLQHIGAGCEF